MNSPRTPSLSDALALFLSFSSRYFSLLLASVHAYAWHLNLNLFRRHSPIRDLFFRPLQARVDLASWRCPRLLRLARSQWSSWATRFTFIRISFLLCMFIRLQHSRSVSFGIYSALRRGTLKLETHQCRLGTATPPCPTYAGSAPNTLTGDGVVPFCRMFLRRHIGRTELAIHASAWGSASGLASGCGGGVYALDLWILQNCGQSHVPVRATSVGT